MNTLIICLYLLINSNIGLSIPNKTHCHCPMLNLTNSSINYNITCKKELSECNKNTMLLNNTIYNLTKEINTCSLKLIEISNSNSGPEALIFMSTISIIILLFIIFIIHKHYNKNHNKETLYGPHYRL